MTVDIETLELADATRDHARALDRHSEALTGVTKGDKGTPGRDGEPGPTGPAGPAGKSIVGLTGPAGRDGIDGLPGRDGVNGKAGAKGPAGASGKDGVGLDEKVKLDARDPEAGFLEDKLQPGLNVAFRRSPDGKALVIDTNGSGGGGGIGVGPTGPAGPPGADGTGIPDGGTTGQVLAKQSNADGDADWEDNAGAGTDDQTAAEVPFTPAGTIAATDVQAAIEEVAAEASGLPPQWTDGGNGDVTATVDDETKTAITVEGIIAQTGDLAAVTRRTYVQASLLVGSGANALTFVAIPLGSLGNVLAVRYVNDGASQPLTISETATQLTVHLATDGGGVVTSTVADVRDAVSSSTLVTTLTDTATFTGAGLAATMASTPLTGGGQVATGLLRVRGDGVIHSAAIWPFDDHLLIDVPGSSHDVGADGAQYVMRVYDTLNDYDVMNVDIDGHLELNGPQGQLHVGDNDSFVANADVAQDAANAVSGLWGVKRAGQMYFREAPVAADGDIDAGMVTFRFDPTDGAATLKIKGKSADGTVVSATIPLT